MGGLFNMDSKLMQALGRLFDLMLINVLTLICCLPVITIGAGFTAMHTMMYRLYKNDEGYIIRNFWKAFKSNFRQATLLWLIYLVIGLLLGVDQWVLAQNVLQLNSAVQVAVVIGIAAWLISFSWVFILLSRYLNPIRITMKNTILVGLTHPIKTLLMIVVFLLPVPVTLLISWGLPVCLLFGLSVPAYLQCRMYRKVFAQIEGEDDSAKEMPESEEDFVQ